MKVLHISAAVCSFISLLFLLLALGSNNWQVNEGASLGLWKFCFNNRCSTIDAILLADYFHTTRAFMLLGMIAGAVSLCGLCAMFWRPNLGSLSLALISCIASFTAAVFVMIAMSVFSGKTENLPYGWSFGLGWASFPFYLITGGLAFMSNKETATSE